MGPFLRAMFAVALLAWGSTAHAETIVRDGVNCRSAPKQTSPVLGRLDRGDAVTVLSSSRGWTRVDPATLPTCWVRDDLLGAASTSAYPYPAATRQARQARTSGARSGTYGLYAAPRGGGVRRSASRASGRSRARGLYDGGSCPCSGSSICVGPRGGRYCITSGGNKRYGV